MTRYHRPLVLLMKRFFRCPWISSCPTSKRLTCEMMPQKLSIRTSWECFITQNKHLSRTLALLKRGIACLGTTAPPYGKRCTDAVPLAFYCIEPEGCEKGKPPIIFIHGVTASKEFWNDIPRNVAKKTKRKVYAVDLRNHGESEWSDADNFECYVDDLFLFINSIGASKVTLVGHSLGGATAMRIAWMANERVEKIVVEDMPIKMVPPFIHEMVLMQMSLNQAALQHLPSGLDEGEAKQFIADFVHSRVPPEIKAVISKPAVEQYDGKLKPTEDGRYAFRANINALRTAVQNAKERHPEPKGVYNGPACFIYGKRSPFQVATDEENIKKFFPNAEMVGIENATHLVHVDFPQEFTDVLLRFLSKE